MKIIAGNSNKDLAEKIAEHCFTDIVPSDIKTFADGECSVEFLITSEVKMFSSYRVQVHQ